MSNAPLGELEKLLAEDPTDVRRRLWLADAYRTQGRPDDALAHYLEAARQFAREGLALKALTCFRVCIGMGAPVQTEALEQARKLGFGVEAITPIPFPTHNIS